MNTKEQAAQKIADFLKSDKQVLLLNGTHSQEKHRLAMQVVQAELPPVTVLLRTNNQQHVARLAGRFHSDTFNIASQRKTPNAIDVAVVWPIDSLGPDKGGNLMADLRMRGVQKTILVTWIDNTDLSWVDNYAPEKITYDVEAENPVQHEASKATEANVRHVGPRNLPAYAKDTDPKHLVRRHCDKCRSSTWSKLNKPYPGKDVLNNAASGEYIATCLRCGDEVDDNYNWYGQA